MLFLVKEKTIEDNFRNPMKNIISIGFLIILLTGCGAELAYKQGANARDLQAGKAACLKAGDETTLNKCLESNGWAVQQLDNPGMSNNELFATASVTEDNRMTANADKEPKTKETEIKSNSVETTSSLKMTKSVETISSTGALISAETASSVGSKNNVEIQNTVKSEQKNLSSVQDDSSKDIKKEVMSEAKPTRNLLDTYVIKSWWKMGGGLTLLDKNMKECGDKLGAAHQPNKKTFTFTRGFAICMREKGWRGLVEK